MRIRGYRASDAVGIARVFRRSVEALGPRDYSAEQVAAWSARTPSPEAVAARAADGRTTLIAADEDDQPIAFIDLEPDGHIDLFYCAPEAAGLGAADALYEAVEALARGKLVPRLYSEASEAALRFFLKRGFTSLGRRDVVLGGVTIHNYGVEKALPPPA